MDLKNLLEDFFSILWIRFSRIRIYHKREYDKNYQNPVAAPPVKSSGIPLNCMHAPASSRMRTSMLSREKVGVFFTWSISRPGVAITTSGFFLKHQVYH